MQITMSQEDAVELVLQLAETNCKSGALMHAEALGMLCGLQRPTPNPSYSTDKEVQYHYEHGFKQCKQILARITTPQPPKKPEGVK